MSINFARILRLRQAFFPASDRDFFAGLRLRFAGLLFFGARFFFEDRLGVAILRELLLLRFVRVGWLICRREQSVQYLGSRQAGLRRHPAIHA